MITPDPKEFSDLAKEFFSIANAIAAFSLAQTLLLVYAFEKEARIVAAFHRWRPVSSAMAKWAVNSYIIGIIICGMIEVWLRREGGQSNSLLIATMVATILRCVGIYIASLFYLKVFVQICREEDWRNKNTRNQTGNNSEIKVPRLKYEHLGIEKFLYEKAEKIDEKLFEAKLEEEISVEKFPNGYKGKQDKKEPVNKKSGK